jgi:alpha-tubulin suppressor-like RCC1 family protein
MRARTGVVLRISTCSSLLLLVGCSSAANSGGGSLAGVTAISAGSGTTYALLSNGTVDCWGTNAGDALGNGTTSGPDSCTGSPCSTTPVAVTGLAEVTAISVGDSTACALLSSGAVDCWGDNSDGELGNGTTTGSSVPVPVPAIGG